MKNLRPVIKATAEKWGIREWVVSKFPEKYQEMTYIEPYGGSLEILFCKDRSRREIVSDIDKEIINIYRAIRDEPSELTRRMNLYKHTPETFDKIEKKKGSEDYLEEAVHDLMLRRMSRNGQKKTYLRMTNQKTWKDSIMSLLRNGERMREVFVLERGALEVIRAFDAKDTLVYCDPPYLRDTKSMLYEPDINPDDHIELHRALSDFTGKVVLSGCLSPLYKRLYKNWNMSMKRINMAKDKRTEIIWTNF